MIWFNYKARTLNTPLSGPVILPSANLEEVILNLDDTSLYHCYYDLEKRTSFVDYDGLMKPVFDTLHVDLDSKDDGGEKAWEDTKKLCHFLNEQSVPFHLYFSGNKGFHVAIHKSALNIDVAPKAELELVVKTFIHSLKKIYPSVDPGIWNANRKFRAFRSRHETSGLFKTRLTGLGIRAGELTLSQIKELATTQQRLSYAHPAATSSTLILPSISTTHATQPHPQTSVQLKEPEVGQTTQDESLKFRNYTDKKCIPLMETTSLPQFNRHDIGLRLIYDYRAQGLTIEQVKEKILKWAEKVFTEPGSSERIKDTARMVEDAFSKPQDYQFSCYDQIKQAYCTAKCKLYDSLDRKKRVETVDCNSRQKKENDIRRKEDEKSEGELADKILNQMPELCKSNGQYFQWIQTHWKRIDGPMFEDSLTKVAIGIYGNQATIKKIKALTEHVIAKIPMAPESNNFFTSSHTKFNFTDCTAEVISVDGKLSLLTKEHNKKDYLGYCAPFPLKAQHDLPRGGAFKEYLQVREKDLGPDGLKIIKQMLGAALIPYSPRVFFIEGVTNSGKSTLALLTKRLLGEENVAEVQPVIHSNGGDRFNWEPSIGKLANIVLELDDRKPLDTTVLKMVRDKTSVNMDRKGRGHVRATLPFFHVYCCNFMPPSLEGNSGALNNRVTMLYFKPGYLNGHSGILDYAEYIWTNDAGGVLEAAREGLRDLMESGFKYYENDSTRAANSDWQKINDSITLFMEDLQIGEFKPTSLEGKEWELGSYLYVAFSDWCKVSGKKPMGKHHFYKLLRVKFNVPCQEHGRGGVRFKVSGFYKNDTDIKTTQKFLEF